MKSKILTIILMLAYATADIFASSEMEKGDSAYSAGRYTEAISDYNTLLDSIGSSAPLLYNLGNAYYHNGDLGNAMLNWLRARRLDPGNKDINANIEFLTSRVEDANKAEQKGRRLKVTPDESSFFQEMNRSISENVSSDTWAVWGAVFFLLFMGGTTVYIFTRRVIWRKLGFFGGIVCISGCLLMVIFSFMSANAMSSDSTGVITTYKTTLLTEPGMSGEGKPGNILTQGTVVQILSEEIDAEGNVTWYKIRLNSDYIGWVSVSELQRVIQ